MCGVILPENVRMINLCKKLGFTIKHTREELVLELKLG